MDTPLFLADPKRKSTAQLFNAAYFCTVHNVSRHGIAHLGTKQSSIRIKGLLKCHTVQSKVWHLNKNLSMLFCCVLRQVMPSRLPQQHLTTTWLYLSLPVSLDCQLLGGKLKRYCKSGTVEFDHDISKRKWLLFSTLCILETRFNNNYLLTANF